MTTEAKSRLERMTREECVELLSRSDLGRLVVVEDGRPLIFPVNFAMDGDAPVFRTAPGTKLWASTHSPVAFEVDEVDRKTHTGWSVIVHGIAQEITAFDRADLQARVYGLPVEPWAAGDKPVFVRVVPRFVTGRRLGTLVPSA
jgi:nitroimidazol reductase NimA-like FMN-containing flavoprotein (pyridoxamine 5'-phosphate oxidase superfamily)